MYEPSVKIKDKKSNGFMNLIKQDLKIYGLTKRRSNPSNSLMIIKESEKKTKSFKDLPSSTSPLVSDTSDTTSITTIEEPIPEEVDVTKFPFNLSETQVNFFN